MPECAQAEPCQTRTSALPICFAVHPSRVTHHLGAAAGGNSCAGRRLPHRSHPPGLGPRPGHRSPAGGRQHSGGGRCPGKAPGGQRRNLRHGGRRRDSRRRDADLPLWPNRQARRPAATSHRFAVSDRLGFKAVCRGAAGPIGRGRPTTLRGHRPRHSADQRSR